MALEAQYWEAREDGRVLCKLCPQACLLKDGQKGLCRSRACDHGKMQLLNYGKTIAFSLDPIEKKPLYHFHPGSQILSLGPNSCNLQCSFCQNYQISQMDQETRDISPEQLLQFLSARALTQVAFTYTEPLTWFEYILDFAALASDIDIVLVTNGFLNPEPFHEISRVTTAMNIDLKSIRPGFYKDECHGMLETVLDNISWASKSGIHLELTNLLIPGLNDSLEDISALINFCASLSEDTILHFSAYHPAYRQTRPATPFKTVLQACELARAKLNYVYAGNITAKAYQDTLCPNCGRKLIQRTGWKTVSEVQNTGCCPSCSFKTKGVF